MLVAARELGTSQHQGWGILKLACRWAALSCSPHCPALLSPPPTNQERLKAAAILPASSGGMPEHCCGVAESAPIGSWAKLFALHAHAGTQLR